MRTSSSSARRCTTSPSPASSRPGSTGCSVAGKTFRYTAEGPEGLAGGRTVIIASSRGGLYGAETPTAAADFQEPYLRFVFGFMGVSDVRFVRAEGVAYGPDQRQAALDAALAATQGIAKRSPWPGPPERQPSPCGELCPTRPRRSRRACVQLGLDDVQAKTDTDCEPGRFQ